MPLMTSTNSTKFGTGLESQKLNKVDEDYELIESEKKIISAKEKEDLARIRQDQRKLNEKEQKFRNKYRWAEKQHKLRTGKCEGYSFTSIKAGLKRQDFHDTINWSPANKVKSIEPSGHMASIVKQLLLVSQPNSSTFGDADSVGEYDETYPSAKLEGHMSEEDWQLARSRRMKPLRMRGSNTISSQMNLDAFIDSALTEQLKEDFNAQSDMTLNDLQSPKLIESRFGWSKVRRAITSSTSAKISPVKSSAPAIMIASAGSSRTPSPNVSGKSSPAASKGMAPRARSASRFTFDGPKVEAKPTTESNAKKSPTATPQTGPAATAAVTVSVSRPPLSFQVPESVTHIRPKSAIIIPSKNAHSILTPVNEFVAVVRQEIARPKSSHVHSPDRSRLASQDQAERPKTATFRITDTKTVHQIAEKDMIEAMQSLHLTLAGEELLERAANLKKEARIYEHYSGLIYRDPNRSATWQGVDSLLAPPPLLHQSTDEELFDGGRASNSHSDMRWAGQTLNSYRPWSPSPDQMPAYSRGRGTRGSVLMQFNGSGSPNRRRGDSTSPYEPNQLFGNSLEPLAEEATITATAVAVEENSPVTNSRLQSLPYIGAKGSPSSSSAAAATAGVFPSTRALSGMTVSAAPSREASAASFSPQRARSPSPHVDHTQHHSQEGAQPRQRPSTAHASPHHRHRPNSLDAKSAGLSQVSQQNGENLHHSFVYGQSLTSMSASHAHTSRSSAHSGHRASSASSRRTPLLINLITRHHRPHATTGTSMAKS